MMVSAAGQGIVDSIVPPTRGERLKLALDQGGYRKQQAFAVLIGVNESTITRWKQNHHMSLEHASVVCAALGISLDWLVFGSGAMFAPSSNETELDRAETAALRNIDLSISRMREDIIDTLKHSISSIRK